MSTTLYILTKTVQRSQDDFSTYIQQTDETSSQSASYVFIQEGLAQQDQIGKMMYGIQINGKSSDQGAIFKSISYNELLVLIFNSKNVIVL